GRQITELLRNHLLVRESGHFLPLGYQRGPFYPVGAPPARPQNTLGAPRMAGLGWGGQVAARTGVSPSEIARLESARGRNSMRKSGSRKGKSPSRLIDERIKELGDWRGKMLSQLRTLIKQADPEVVEEWKWRGVPVWSHDGLICTGDTYKNVVKMTFSKGAALEDPSGLFNSSLDGNTRRAIDFHEGEKIDEEALKALIGAAVTLNASRAHG